MPAANNVLALIGRVGKDPETRQAGATTLTTFSLAVDRQGRKDQQGNKITDWVSIKTWGKQAELARDLIRKGAQIAVAGSLNIDEYTDKQGVKQRMVICNADSFQLLDKRQDSDANPQHRQAQFDDSDIPEF